MTLDGTIHHTYPTPGLHHAFVPLPEDRLAIPVNYCAAQIFAPAWFDPLFTALRC